jgi:hypothetical protein
MEDTMRMIKTIIAAGLGAGALLSALPAEAQFRAKQLQDLRQVEQVKRAPVALEQRAETEIFEKILEQCKSSGTKDIPGCIDKEMSSGKYGITAVRQQVKSDITPAYFSQLFAQTPKSTDACANGNFEQDMAGWTGFRMRHSGNALPHENGMTAQTPFISNACSTGYGQTCLAMETGGVDPQLAPAISLNKTFAGKSLRMGDYTSVGRGAEGVARKFTVTPQNARYTFKYAIQMDKSHPGGDSAFFQAIAIDAQGNIIDRYDEVAEAANPFIQSSADGREYYRDWQCAELDLTPALNTDVVVYFLNSDCAQGGHNGHTYIDEVCGSCAGNSQGFIEINAQTDSCLKRGETQGIGGNFNVPAGATGVSVEMQVYRNGSLVTTLTNGTITGGAYNFNVTQADFPRQECYDLVAVLKFNLQNMNNQSVPVEVVSSSENGFKVGQNNDLCLNCPTIGDVIDGGVIGTVGNLNDIMILEPAVVAPTLSDCCPPFTKDQIMPLFAPEFQGAATGPFRLKYRLGSPEVNTLNSQMQAYINYLNSMDSTITDIIININVRDKGPIGGPVVPGNGNNMSSMGAQFIAWTAGGNGTPSNGGGNFWNNYGLQPNQEYRIQTGIYLNDGKKFFKDDCAVKEDDFHWQVSGMRSAGGNDGQGQFVVGTGETRRVVATKQFKMEAAPRRMR